MKKFKFVTFSLVTFLLPVFSLAINSSSSYKLNQLNNEFEVVDDTINKDVANGFGGAVLLVIKDGEIVKQTAYGYQNMFKKDCKTNNDYSIPENCYENDSKRVPLETDSIFDLASLTKVYSTVLAMMHLTYTGQLDINEPVAYYINDYPYKDITVKQVAEHTAGFGPEVNFYNKNDIMHNSKTVLENGFYSQDREKTIDFIIGAKTNNNPNGLIVPREYEPGTKNVYSDTDFILLGVIIESIVGMPLNEYVENTLYKPLDIDIKYHPISMNISLEKIVQTSIGNWSVIYDKNGVDFTKLPYDNIRENPIVGFSHDEKVFYSMGGVSGHAGLFGSAEDLAILVKLLLNGGSYNRVTLFDQKTIDMFTAPVGENDTYATGWRRAGDQGKMSWMMGKYASENTYGHTAFTGMDTIIDPDNNLGIILLTNKLQSQQLEKGNFKSNEDFVTPNYEVIMTAVQKAVGLRELI